MIEKLTDYLRSGGSLNIELFRILGIGGIGISVISCINSILISDDTGAVIDAGAAVLAILLLYFVDKTGYYRVGYVIVEVCVFMILFSLLYFEGGGINGSMPYYFSFALLFNFLMFEGRTLVLMESLLSAFYLTIFLVSIRFPQLVQVYNDPVEINRERIIGVFLTAYTMGMICLLYIREYRKQKRISEEANIAKSVFLANMSHEIRTPINSVLGYNEMILRTTNDPAAREYSGYIEQSGHQLLAVINEILDFSRFDSGKGDVIIETFSLGKLAEEANTLMAIMAKPKSLDFKMLFDDRIQDPVLGDREKLMRILTNLLSNAFKYTKHGSVTLRIQLVEMNKGGQTIRFQVEDTGIGIRETDIENLFHAYERADLMKNRKIEGTGLGLAITEQLVGLLGGRLQVKSTYGKGSTFSFELIMPAADMQEPSAVSDRDHHPFLAPDARILVTDDDEMNRKLMDSFLSTYGITADFADSGIDCLRLTGKNTYHLVLMDYMMPGMDGAATLEKLREREAGAGRHTPVAVLTADVSEDTRRKLLKKGFDDYLPKPVALTSLEEMLIRYIPSELRLPGYEDSSEKMTTGQLEACENLLKEKGILFSEGMRLVNGDFDQYLRIASMFLRNADSDRKKLRTAAGKQDLAALRLVLHSLKGNAGSIGATELRTLAENLESKCREADREYVLCGLDLLLLQWNRCLKGLKELLDAQPSAPEEKPGLFAGYSFEDLTEELCRNLTLCEGKKAKAAAEQMKAAAAGPQQLQTLNEIEQLIDNLEFDTALEMAAERLGAYEAIEDSVK